MKASTRRMVQVGAVLMGSVLVSTSVVWAVARKRSTSTSRKLAKMRAPSSHPRDFVLFRSRSGKPKLIVRVDTQIYLPGVSYRRFLRTGGARTSEELTARRIQLLEDLATGAAAYRALYQPNPDSAAATPQALNQQFVAQRPYYRRRKRSYTFLNRYDVGDYSWLVSKPVRLDWRDSPQLLKLGKTASIPVPLVQTTRRFGTRTYLTNDLFVPTDAGMMVGLLYKQYPLSAPDTSLPYSLRLSHARYNAPKEKEPKQHPLDVLFGGRFLNVAFDGKTLVNNAAAQFVQNAVGVFKSRNQSAILRLWSAASAKELAPLLQAKRPVEWLDYSLTEQLMQGNQGMERRIIFVLDLGQDAVVFLRDAGKNPSFSRLLLHWENGGYKFFLSHKLDHHPLATLNFATFLSSAVFKQFLEHGFRAQTQPGRGRQITLLS